MDNAHKHKINNLMATFKNLEDADERNEIGDHLEKEFLDIIHLFTTERKQQIKLLDRLKVENKQLKIEAHEE